jgi:hypothetical protein
MRLLPRSPGGTWLLAAAAWLAGCAAAWWLLPVRPRSAWHAPAPARPVGVLADGTLVTIDMNSGFESVRFVRFWHIADQAERTPEPFRGRHATAAAIACAGHRLLAVLRDETGRSFRFCVYDAVGGRMEGQLPTTGYVLSSDVDSQAITADGRTLAFIHAAESKCLLEVSQAGTRAVLARGTNGPLALSADGRWLAAAFQRDKADLEAGGRIRVWDLRTRTSVREIPSSRRIIRSLEFAPDEPDLLAVVSTSADYPGDPGGGCLMLVNVVTGLAATTTPPATWARFLPDRRDLLMTEWGGLTRRNRTSGERGYGPVPIDTDQTHQRELPIESRDGRVVGIGRSDEALPAPLRTKLARWTGLDWLSPDDHIKSITVF